MKHFMQRLSLLFLLFLILKVSGILPDTVVSKAAGEIEIATAEQLQKIGSSGYPLDGHYKLTGDIDLSDISFTPIGGTEGGKGSVEGDNVFSGTFDGQGHLISNMNIQLTGTPTGSNYSQIGLFSIIASSNPSKPAEVKNLVLADVFIKTNISGSMSAVGSLAGEVNGYAKVDNIAVLSGELYINGNSDLVGAGGVIGECRTEDSVIGNKHIEISNIYNGAEIIAWSSENNNFVGGIIGRIAKSNCKSLSNCVNVGQTEFKGDLGSGIVSLGDNTTNEFIKNCHFLFDTGRQIGSGTTEWSEREMKSSGLLPGLSPEKWYASEDEYPLLSICKNPGTAGYLALAASSPIFANEDNASNVTCNFSLPLKTGDTVLSWESNNTDVITISGNTAIVNHVFSDTKVILTVSAPGGLSRRFTVNVVSNINAHFEQDYAKPGNELKAVVANAPTDMKFAYSWKVGGQAMDNMTNTYIPRQSDLEKFITVTITSTNYDATWELTMYCSELPVVYINTLDGQKIYDKNYKNANFKLQGNDEFSDSNILYDGLTEIKGRGNSTWGYAQANELKKPYKLKLNKKANIFGMGKNKHWVLLANLIDHTNMRNQLLYEFSHDVGMEYYLESTNVVLILNHSYEGVYQFCESKRIDETRVNVFSWENLAEDIASAITSKEGLDSVLDDFEEAMKSDFSWYETGKFKFLGKTYTISQYYKKEIPDFTGGFLTDMDFRLGDSKYISKFWTTYNQPFFIDTPEYIKTSPDMMNFTQNYIQTVENALHSDDFYTVYNGKKVHYSELIDIQSFVQNWMVIEHSMDWDGMKNSTLMYKDLEGLLKIGPVWDFDWAWGNICMYNSPTWVIHNWQSLEQGFWDQREQQEQQWNRYFTKDPYFAVLVYELWHKVRSTYIEDMIKSGGKIDQLKEKYKTASKANDVKWAYSYENYSGIGITNGNVVYKHSETYEDAINTMKYFISKRIDWLDEQFTSVDHLLKSWSMYKSSDRIAITDIDISTHTNATEITALVNQQNASKISFYVNGILAETTDVSNGTAKVIVSDEVLRNKNNAMNVVQVRALNSSGNFLKSGSDVITDYKVFNKKTIVSITGTVAITGKASVNNKLEAVVKTDATGNLSYQWYANDMAISGANAKFYKITESELGKRISVIVSSDEEIGFLSSKKTETVLNILESNGVHPIINQIYGGGSAGDTPLSHSFIEIYNPTQKAIHLDGYQIGYVSTRTDGNQKASTDGEIVKRNLIGTIPAKASYLIRCAAENPSETIKYTITSFDLEWKQIIDNHQYQMILLKENLVIDGVSVDESELEGTVVTDISKQKAIRRKDFKDTDHNAVDFELIDYRTCNYEMFRPRSLIDGAWGGLSTTLLTGTVVIQGDAIVGNILTANLTNSNNTGNIQYQWKANEIDIPGANAKTYLLTEKEVGKVITVVVNSTVELGGIFSKPTTTVMRRRLPDSISLNNTKIFLQKGKSIYLKPNILPFNTTEKDIQWNSSNKKTALVEGQPDNSGKVTAKSKGTTIITAKTTNGKSVTCKITVGEVKLNVSSAKMQVGQTTKVFVITNRYPKNDKVVKWFSSKPRVASISKSGKVKAKKAGTTVLSVKMNSKATATIKLNVAKTSIKTKKIILHKIKISLKKGTKYPIKFNRAPITANDKIIYTTSKKKIAIVNNKGIVKALSRGTATIKIKTASGKKATVKVSVK